VIHCWAMGWMIGNSSPCRSCQYFCSPPRPDRFWGPPSLLSHQKLFPWGKAAGLWSWSLTSI